jgi:hypothetical protein
MENITMEYESAGAYAKALKTNPATLSLMPVSLAADVLEKPRSGILRLLRDGRLTPIKIDATTYVQTSSVLAWRDNREFQVKRVRAFLEKLAADRKTVFYEPVMNVIGLTAHHRPDQRKQMGGILGTISWQTWEEHHLLLSVIVHKKVPGKGKTYPSIKGFRSLLESIDIYPGDLKSFIDEMQNKVFSFYSGKKK